MRRLHVLGISADGQQLLLGTQPDGQSSHQVQVDDRLLRVLRGERPAGGLAPTTLSPREIQASLRAGATVEEVAAAAGTTVARIERYAGPVLSERAQVLQAALGATVRRGRSARASVPLGTAMERFLATLSHVRPETATWHTWRGADGRWTVRYEVVVRGRPRIATWHFDQPARELTALDPFAVSLGYAGEPPPPPPTTRPKPASAKPVSAKTASAKPASPKPASAKPASPKPPARRGRTGA